MTQQHQSSTSTASRRPSRRGRRAGFAALALAGVTAVLPAQGAHAAPATGPAANRHGQDDTRANGALVLGFVDALFNRADLTVIDRDTDGYIQHNPSVADGPEGLRQLVVFLHGLFPQSQTTVQRVIAQGDLVLLQDKVVSVPGTQGQSIIDIYRVEHGKIVEHWDNLTPVQTSTVNGHDQFATLSAPQTQVADPNAPTRLNERVVARFLRSLHRLPQRGNHYLAEDLIQHDPALADGAAATEAHYAEVFAANPLAAYEVVRTVAQGDLVAVHSHFRRDPQDLGQSVVDIFRVRNGKIVEHWDGIQDVPATSANTNGMF